jgi:hypothetical protein
MVCAFSPVGLSVTPKRLTSSSESQRPVGVARKRWKFSLKRTENLSEPEWRLSLYGASGESTGDGGVDLDVLFELRDVAHVVHAFLQASDVAWGQARPPDPETPQLRRLVALIGPSKSVRPPAALLSPSKLERT